MTNLTISIDEAVVRQARVRAIQEGTSVSAKVRDFLAVYAQGGQPQQSAAQDFIAAARSRQAQVDQASRTTARWSRADAHDRPYPGLAPGRP
ncbi:MAG: DUF6364 family protein [Hydrogenophaga sp.]|jgi:plasmid stability protein|nr:DUF6364 family protein [Hydrogenophaga sp.]